jgi:hypothetical protein
MGCFQIDDITFVGEVVDSMGAFAQANRWSVENLKKIISQQKDEIKSFEKVLQQQKSLVEIDFQNQINVIKQQHQINSKISRNIGRRKSQRKMKEQIN